MSHHIEKASALVEALPYIQRFNQKIFVIKCGGAAITNSAQMHSIMRDAALLHCCGIRVVIVHGGGPDISALCAQMQIETQFVEGQRVTDAATMAVVQMVLIGKTNKSLVAALNQYGAKAVGICGQDARCLTAEKISSSSSELDLGFVGQIKEIDTKLIYTLLDAHFLPVIAPVSSDMNGQAYNINADIAAGAIASALKAEKFIYLSDVNGVYANPKDPNTSINEIDKTTVKRWLAEKTITGGMIPKLQSCVDALDSGVTSAHILDGNMPHSLLLEIFTHQGIGTFITQ